MKFATSLIITALFLTAGQAYAENAPRSRTSAPRTVRNKPATPPATTKQHATERNSTQSNANGTQTGANPNRQPIDAPGAADGATNRGYMDTNLNGMPAVVGSSTQNATQPSKQGSPEKAAIGTQAPITQTTPVPPTPQPKAPSGSR